MTRLRLHKVLSGEVAAMCLQGVLVCIVAATGEAHPAETSELGPVKVTNFWRQHRISAIHVFLSSWQSNKINHFRYVLYICMYIYNQLASNSTILGFTVTPRPSPILGQHSRLGPSLQARQDMATQPSGSGSSGQWHLGQCIVRHSATCTMRHDASGKSGSSLQQKHRGLMVNKP